MLLLVCLLGYLFIFKYYGSEIAHVVLLKYQMELKEQTLLHFTFLSFLLLPGSVLHRYNNLVNAKSRQLQKPKHESKSHNMNAKATTQMPIQTKLCSSTHNG